MFLRSDLLFVEKCSSYNQSPLLSEICSTDTNIFYPSHFLHRLRLELTTCQNPNTSSLNNTLTTLPPTLPLSPSTNQHQNVHHPPALLPPPPPRRPHLHRPLHLLRHPHAQSTRDPRSQPPPHPGRQEHRRRVQERRGHRDTHARIRRHGAGREDGGSGQRGDEAGCGTE